MNFIKILKTTAAVLAAGLFGIGLLIGSLLF